MADLPKNEKHFVLLIPGPAVTKVKAPKRVYQAKDDTHLLYAHIPAWLYSQMKRRMAERIAEGEQITEEKYIIAALDSYSSTFFGR